jgi:hypothetical protein
MRFWYTLAFICFLVVPARAGELTADEIAQKASVAAYYAGADGKARAKMTITDSQGRIRQREMTILRKDITEGGEQKFYVYFHKPNDVRGMSYIVWKHTGKDDDRWLYLPALDLVKRIAGSDKRSSFAGSQFTYEDISGRGTDQDSHELVSSDQTSYVLKSTPKDLNLVEFSRYIVTIDAGTFLPTKAEYYDKNNKLYRVIEALEVRDIEGYPTIVKMKAQDYNAKATTVTEFSGMDYDVSLSDDMFTERYLRIPPSGVVQE